MKLEFGIFVVFAICVFAPASNAVTHIGDRTFSGLSRFDIQAVTIADSGSDAIPATATIEATRNVITCECADDDGCVVSLGETIGAGTRISIIGHSSNPCQFADTGGVLELDSDAGFSMTENDVLELVYGPYSSWIEAGRKNNDND